MGINSNLFAVSAARAAAMKAQPSLATEEARTRGGLALLASWRSLRPNETEAEHLARIRSAQRAPEGADQELCDWLTSLYALERRGLDAALALGDREKPFELGEAHVELDMILLDAAAFRRLLQGGDALGLDCGYGPARLHDPTAVCEISDALAAFDDDRFLSAARAGETIAVGDDDADADDGFDRPSDEHAALLRLFSDLKAYVAAAAASGQGLLVWMS